MLVVGAGWTKVTAETFLGIAGLAVFLIATILGIVLLVDARGARPPPSIKVPRCTARRIRYTGQPHHALLNMPSQCRNRKNLGV
jgi:hypothetical protein